MPKASPALLIMREVLMLGLEYAASDRPGVRVCMGATQVVVFVKQQLGAEGMSSDGAPSDVGSLLRSPALAYFIRNTVTIHSVLTHRIDHLRPSVQLTLKVATVMGMRVCLPFSCHAPVLQCRRGLIMAAQA